MGKSINTIIMMSLIFLSALNSYADQSNTTHPEAVRGFRYAIPKGWTIAEVHGLKYKMAHGITSDGFTPNIKIVDETFDGSVEDFANINLEQIKAKNLKNSGKSNFVTNSGIKGFKLVTETTQGRNHLRQAFYFFNGKGGKKLVVTCSSLAKDGDTFSKLFDDSLKSFDVK